MSDFLEQHVIHLIGWENICEIITSWRPVIIYFSITNQNVQSRSQKESATFLANLYFWPRSCMGTRLPDKSDA